MPTEPLPPDDAPPQSLKEILYSELGSQFTTILAQDSSFTTESRKALASLLGRPDVISAQILSALELRDPEIEEVQSE